MICTFGVDCNVNAFHLIAAGKLVD